MSENWCREGCCAGSASAHSIQKMEDPYKAVRADYPVPAPETVKRPVHDNLDQLAKNLETLGMALEMLRNRLQPVSQQIDTRVNGLVDAPLNGSSDVSARLFNYSCRVYGFETFVEELIRDLEI